MVPTRFFTDIGSEMGGHYPLMVPTRFFTDIGSEMGGQGALSLDGTHQIFY